MVGCNINDNDYFLGWDVLNYFIKNPGKRVLDYYLSIKGSDGKVGIEETNMNRILDELCKRNYLYKISGINNVNSAYFGQTCELMRFDKNVAANIINCFCFGFEYIYKAYKNNIRLLIGTRDGGIPDSGTCFICGNSIYTAGHCIKNMYDLNIEGFTKEELQRAKAYSTKIGDIDVARIDIEVTDCKHAFFSDAKILDDVIVMGFPTIPGFQNFLTVEKASVSSIGKIKSTVTKGQVVAIEELYLSQCDLMLITAKIRGGNSGGPVINSSGFFVGVVLELPDYSNNKEDDLGYGICVPYQTIRSAIDNSLFEEIPFHV